MAEPKTQRERDIYLKGYKDAEKAYGGCHFCYGKGYWNAIVSAPASKTKVKITERLTPCSCERGQALNVILSAET